MARLSCWLSGFLAEGSYDEREAFEKREGNKSTLPG